MYYIVFINKIPQCNWNLSVLFDKFLLLNIYISAFRVADDFSWWKFRSLPLFLGQLIGAYEGIGCVSIRNLMDLSCYSYIDRIVLTV